MVESTYLLSIHSPDPAPPHATRSRSGLSLACFFLLLSSEAVIKVSLSCFVFIKLHVVSACPFALSLAYGCGYSVYLFSPFSSLRFFCACALFSSHLLFLLCVPYSIFLQFIYIYTSWWLEENKKKDSRRKRVSTTIYIETRIHGWKREIEKETQTIHSIRIDIAIWHLLLLYMSKCCYPTTWCSPSNGHT